MPPAYEVLLLNTTIPQIQAAQSGDTYVVPRDIAINATAIISANSATDALRITQTGAGNAILVEDSANPDATPFVVTAAGDVGIGTSSPAYKLDVVAAGGVTARVQNTASTADAYFTAQNTTGPAFFGINATGPYIYTAQSIPILFYTAGSERMRLDSSGNLGLGVSPSAWAASSKAITIGFDGGMQLAGGTSSTQALLTTNLVFTGTGATGWKLPSNVAGTYYEQYLGAHKWYYANANGVNGDATPIQAMTLDASGRLGIGETNPAAKVDFGTNAVGIDTPINYIRGFGSSSLWPINISGMYDASDEHQFIGLNARLAGGTKANPTFYSGFGGSVIRQISATALTFNTVGAGTGVLTERARITSGGYFKASDNGSYTSSGSFHEFVQTNDASGLSISCSNASLTTYGVAYIEAARNTTNNTFYAISYYNSGAAAYKFRVADSGDVTNTNGTYGTISDAKMKTDIVDAGSQWSDIKALRFRKFKMKDDPSGLVQLGVVAQEVELTSPGLVDEHADKDAEGNDLGTTTKSVKTSILLMKAAVALQEAMARIETLEAEVAALKGA